MALDPITAITASAILATGSQVGGQILSNIESKKREAEYKAKADIEDQKFQAAKDRIAAIDFSPGSGIYELQQQRELQAELLGSEADRRGDEREARALAALQDSPRQMQAMAPRIISQSEDAQQKADLQVGRLKAEAAAGTAKAEQSAEDQARKRDMMLDQLDLQRAGKSFDTFTEGAFGERAARVEGNRALMSELGETAIAVGGNLAAVKSAEAAREAALAAAQNQQDFFRSLQTQTDQTGVETDVIQNPIEQYGDFIPDDADPIGQYGPFIPDEAPIVGTQAEQQAELAADQMTNPLTGLPYEFDSSGAYPENYAFGGFIGKDGGITEGEFSHKTNKKAVIDQENGIKEAELTGGEGILNPKQFKNLESVKDLLDKLAAMPSAPAEIKKAAELLKFLEGEQFQDA